MKHTIVVQVDAKGRPIEAKKSLVGAGGPGQQRGESELAKTIGASVKKALAGRAMVGILSNLVQGGTVGGIASGVSGAMKEHAQSKIAAGTGGYKEMAAALTLDAAMKTWTEWQGLARGRALASTENLAATYAAYKIPAKDVNLDAYYEQQYEIEMRQVKARQRIQRKYFHKNPVDGNLYAVGIDLIRGE